MVHPPLTFFLRKSPDFPLRPCVHSDKVDEDKYWTLQKEQNVTHDKHIVGEKRKQHIKGGLFIYHYILSGHALKEYYI